MEKLHILDIHSIDLRIKLQIDYTITTTKSLIIKE